jgi:hypothetical protein
MKIAIVAAAVVLLAACSDPRKQAVPTDWTQADGKYQDARLKLSPDERDLADGYAKRALAGQVAGKPIGAPGVTLGEAVVAQRTFLADEAKAQAEAAALAARVAAEKKAMADAVTVAVVAKKTVEMDISERIYADSVNLQIAMENKSGKTVTGVRGKLIFADSFGRTVKEVPVTSEETMPPGKSSVGTVAHRINKFRDEDRAFAQMDLAKSKVTWEVIDVRFADAKPATPVDALPPAK